MAKNKGHFDAKNLVKAIGAVPWNFVEGTRLLLLDYQAGAQAPSARSITQVSRLLKSKTAIGCLNELCREFYPGLAPRQLEPLTLAVALIFIFLYKRCKAICPEDEWKYLDEFFTRNCEIALRVGTRVPEIGGGFALLGEGFLHVALSIFLVADKRGFQEYRRILKKQKVRFNPAFERETWGCTTAELAAMLLVTCGFKSDIALGLEDAFSEKPSISKESMKIRMCNLAAEVLQDYPVRSASLPPELVKIAPALAELAPRASRILSDEIVTPWFDKTPADGEAAEVPPPSAAEVPPAEASATEAETPPAEAAASEPETFITADGREVPILSHYNDLPENLRANISEEEFKQLQHMPLDEVIALLGG